MKRVVFMAVALLVAACASPAPSAPASSSVASSTPTVAPSSQPTAGPTDLVVSGTGATVQFDGWTATCSDVAADECQGVAALFANNLARSWKSVFDESGGRIRVASRSACPAVPDWADPSRCWQATAQVAAGPICMVIARWPKAEGAVSTFGQVGGDEMAGPAGPAGRWPTCE